MVENVWKVLSKYNSCVQGQYGRQSAFSIRIEDNSQIIGA